MEYIERAPKPHRTIRRVKTQMSIAERLPAFKRDVPVFRARKNRGVRQLLRRVPWILNSGVDVALGLIALDIPVYVGKDVVIVPQR
jgi:hypothetical protein